MALVPFAAPKYEVDALVPGTPLPAPEPEPEPVPEPDPEG